MRFGSEKMLSAGRFLIHPRFCHFSEVWLSEFEWLSSFFRDFGLSLGLIVSKWAYGRCSGHRDVSVGKNPRQRAQGHENVQKGVSEFERVCGHKDVSVGTKACQSAWWRVRAKRRVSGQEGVSVSMKTCQWAKRRVSGQEGVPIGTKEC